MIKVFLDDFRICLELVFEFWIEKNNYKYDVKRFFGLKLGFN